MKIPEHAALKLADLRKTADALDKVVVDGQMGDGEAFIVRRMAQSIRSDVVALELEFWRATGCQSDDEESERPELLH